MDTVKIEIQSGNILEIPKVFNKYTYVQLLGVGGCSAIILVQRCNENALFACKVVSRALLIDQDAVGKFEKELRLLPSLHHPNIVQLEEVVYGSDFIFLIMKYCSNGNLLSFVLSAGFLSECQARDLFKQIVEAVLYIHEHDIAHRDLKLENFLLTNDWSVCLVGFGLCHSDCSRHLLRTPRGSILNAAPEIMLGHKYDGKKTDIWSLGICLFGIVTGALPWKNCDGQDLIQEIQTGDVVVPEILSIELQQLLTWMLQKDSRMRPTIEEVLESKWLGGNVKTAKTNQSLRIKGIQIKKTGGSAESFPSTKGRVAVKRQLTMKSSRSQVPSILSQAPKPLSCLIHQLPMCPKRRQSLLIQK